MKPRQNHSIHGWAVSVILSVGLISIPAMLVAASFRGASSGDNQWGSAKKAVVPVRQEEARLLAKLTPKLSRPAAPRHLSRIDRIAYQYAIEEVYWRQRIWPNTRPDSKPSLDEAMPAGQIEQKVDDYLRNSQLLADQWQRPITAEQLQAEMERMASHTKQPEVLHELFAALDNDPFVIAECLARPVLSSRLITELYVHDQRFHGKLKQRAEADLREHGTVRQMKWTSGAYSEMEWIKNDEADSSPVTANNVATIRMNNSEWAGNIGKLAAQFGNAKGQNAWDRIETGVVTALQENDDYYYATAVTDKSKGRLKVATVAWQKEALESWAARTETEVPAITDDLSADYTVPAIANPSVTCMDDTWTSTSTTNAPSARFSGTSVWTGSEMIVWGGYDGSSYLNTGARYTPATDSWVATTTTSGPSGRLDHTAVWTGSQMIIWGGVDNVFNYLNTGSKYNPSTNSWTTTSITNAPAGRYKHTAVWTSSEMIVWGGTDINGNRLNTGGRYNPSTNTWTATSTTSAPTGREYHTAVWTGTQMVVWGGFDGSAVVNSGGKYNPSTNSWTSTSTTSAPAARTDHTAVWGGNEMIVWGGAAGASYFNSGGKYNPSTNSWSVTSVTNAPSGRSSLKAVWTGGEMIVWGGFDGSSYLNTGGRYDPSANSWTATSATNAPSGRYVHTAVWTGAEMIVWGGFSSGGFLNTGGRYCVQTTLGNYPATSIPLSTDTTVMPDRVPAGTARMTVSTSTNFKGRLEGYPATGVVRVTDAHPAGTYTITVSAFGGGASATKTFTLTVTTPVTCTPVNFAAAANFSSTTNPFSVAVGDFNGDGRQDVAVANINSSNVSILLGNGGGSFNPAVTFGVGSEPRSIAVGDFNGDGKQDLATANYISNNVSILLGDGAGGFTAATNFSIGGFCYAIAVGDFNGDGKQDLAVTNGSNVSILLGDGVGNFGAATSFSAGNLAISVAIGDFNGDGKQDLPRPTNNQITCRSC